MTTIQSWLKLQCPDCGGETAFDKECAVCQRCGRHFECREDIVYLLPKSIEQEALKLREKEGWRRLCTDNLESLGPQYLSLPFSEEHLPNRTHYREASLQWRLAARFLEPLAGKRGLDLGGSIGWAAYHFSLAGARMVLADFNDDPCAGLGGARVYLEQGTAFDRLCVDAERLPLADGQFDFVFCCAFLHHLTAPGRVVRHVARILRPGGVFIATCESFRPLWMSRRRALERCDTAMHYISQGVNEQTFRQDEYARWFRHAGLAMQVVNPRWDLVEPGNVVSNHQVGNSGYEPEVLANRREHPGIIGCFARRALRHGWWRPAGRPIVFPLIRPLLLAGTQKYRLLIGSKQAASE